MRTTPTAKHRRLLARLARAHYLDGLSKVQIAESFGLSRFQVARMLQEAVDAGVVTISIEQDGPESGDRFSDLAHRLGLRSITVVPDTAPGSPVTGDGSTPTATQLPLQMGRAALARVDALARPGMRIGMSWSRTLDSAAAYAPALPRCTVVQLAGALRLDGPPQQTPGIFERLGQDQAVHVVRLFAPLLVTEAETATDLRALPEITNALEAADDLDLAVVSVGAWAESVSSVWEKCDAAVRTKAAQDGAVAEISGRLLGADGSSVTTIDHRVIAVTRGQLRRARTTVGVAHGAARAAAVEAAAASGMVDELIVDEALATALVARQDEEEA
jgi:DNA-binding transcriptional regulator LsrR (DeoR family)